jgi:hypothetical protein
MHCSQFNASFLLFGLEGESFKKTFKKDFKVHKIASSERVNKLMECTLSQNDDKIGSRVEL